MPRLDEIISNANSGNKNNFSNKNFSNTKNSRFNSAAANRKTNAAYQKMLQRQQEQQAAEEAMKRDKELKGFNKLAANVYRSAQDVSLMDALLRLMRKFSRRKLKERQLPSVTNSSAYLVFPTSHFVLWSVAYPICFLVFMKVLLA